jgi:aminoacrylate hydrolase
LVDGIFAQQIHSNTHLTRFKKSATFRPSGQILFAFLLKLSLIAVLLIMNHQIYPSKINSKKTVVLSSGLGGLAQFWQPQIDALTESFNVLTYTQHGVHADSSLLPEDYRLQDMAQELSKLLKSLSLTECHFIGHALGGFIGLEIAKTQPKLIDRLIVINAWDRLDPVTNRCFEARASLLEKVGVAAYVQAQSLFLYPASWLSQHHALIEQHDQHQTEHFPPISNVLTRIKALKAYQPAVVAQAVKHACLVISNQDDLLVPWERGAALAKHLQTAQFIKLTEGGHASTVTRSDHVNNIMLHFLRQ